MMNQLRITTVLPFTLAFSLLGAAACTTGESIDDNNLSLYKGEKGGPGTEPPTSRCPSNYMWTNYVMNFDLCGDDALFQTPPVGPLPPGSSLQVFQKTRLHRKGALGFEAAIPQVETDSRALSWSIMAQSGPYTLFYATMEYNPYALGGSIVTVATTHLGVALEKESWSVTVKDGSNVEFIVQNGKVGVSIDGELRWSTVSIPSDMGQFSFIQGVADWKSFQNAIGAGLRALYIHTPVGPVENPSE